MTRHPYRIAILLFVALVALGLAGCGLRPTPVAPVTPRQATSGSGAGSPVASGKIEGVVIDAKTGKPLNNVMVTTSPGTPGAMSDTQGKFTLADVPVGMYNVEASLKGYDVGFKGNLSIVAGGTQSLQLRLQPADDYPLARVLGVWPTDKQVYPDNKVWITLHGGYAYHDNEKITTTGLNNVGVGTYVYLEGREKDANDKPISGWTWKVTGPSGEAVKVENANTRTPRFLAAREGKYEVTVEANLDGGAKGKSTLTVTAGHYVGAETCQSCHNGSVQADTYSAWLGTGHATKLDTTYGSYTASSDYCVGCHVTGFNETAQNGGFDDLAVKAGWDSGKGSLQSWLVNSKMTLDQIKDSPMGKLAGIQCEACHGPGSAHTGASTYDPAVCEQCHTQGEQWKVSGHATNTGYLNSHTASNASCAPCHSGDGYVVAKVKGQQPVFPSQATPIKPANLAVPGDEPTIACATCHDPHQATNPDEKGASAQLRQVGDVKIPVGATIKAGMGATCVSCHGNNRDAQYKADYAAGKKVRGPHENPQADVVYGIKDSVFDFGEPLGSSPCANKTEDACVTCHMAPNPVLDPGKDGKVGTRDDVLALNVGGHSMAMAGEANGKQVQNTASCEVDGCHAKGSMATLDAAASADYDGNGKVEGLQEEVKGLLKLLEGKLPKDDKGQVLSSTITADNTTEVQREALWNYWLITADGSYGIHNATFTVQLLQKTYQKLTGQPVPNATIR